MPRGADHANVSATSTPKTTQDKLVDRKHKWSDQNIRDYDYALSAEGYMRPFEPSVLISIRDGKLVSIKTPDGKLVTYPGIYDEFSSVEKIFKFLDEVGSKRPYKLNIVYDEVNGYPTYVELDEKEGMSDDELTLRISSLEVQERPV
jgi:hypothetical protein